MAEFFCMKHDATCRNAQILEDRRSTHIWAHNLNEEYLTS